MALSMSFIRNNVTENAKNPTNLLLSREVLKFVAQPTEECVIRSHDREEPAVGYK